MVFAICGTAVLTVTALFSSFVMYLCVFIVIYTSLLGLPSCM